MRKIESTSPPFSFPTASPASPPGRACRALVHGESEGPLLSGASSKNSRDPPRDPRPPPRAPPVRGGTGGRPTARPWSAHGRGRGAASGAPRGRARCTASAAPWRRRAAADAQGSGRARQGGTAARGRGPATLRQLRTPNRPQSRTRNCFASINLHKPPENRRRTEDVRNCRTCEKRRFTLRRPRVGAVEDTHHTSTTGPGTARARVSRVAAGVHKSVHVSTSEFFLISSGPASRPCRASCPPPPPSTSPGAHTIRADRGW